MKEEKKCGCGCDDAHDVHERHGHDCESHVHDCDCGHDDCDCGCEDEVVELVADDGKVMKFYHFGTIEFKKHYYAAFQPAEEIEGVGEDELVIFEVSEGEGDENELLPIEDQDLLDDVYNEFCRIMDEESDEEPAEIHDEDYL